MKFRESLPLKIAAIMLSFITAFITAISAFGILFILDNNYYSRGQSNIRDDILRERAYREAYTIYEKYDGDSFDTDYADKRGIYFSITNNDTGETLDSNYFGQKHLVSSTVEHLEVYKYDDIDGNFYSDGYVNITVYMPDTDKLAVVDKTVLKLSDILFNLRFHLLWIVCAALILTAVLLCYLYAAAGHRKGGEITLNFLDRVPFDIVTVMVVILAVLSVILIDAAISTTLLYGFIILTFTLAADYLIALGYTLTFATRLKTGTLIKNNISYRILKFVWKYIKRGLELLGYTLKNLPLAWKTGLICILVAFIWILVAVRIYYTLETVFVTLMFLFCLSAVAVYISIILGQIKIGGEKIASGELSHKIDTKYMFGDFKSFAESLNNINEGLAVAINEKMKSERFKTELITNVSHDIKTPLTSIINYVDLIKRQEVDNQKVKEYIGVLDRQSARLKKLTEDLVEASKASTGNLTVDLTECEVGVILSQTIGEFDEKLKAAELTPILNQPQNPVKIKADGRHLWRVFDNLMNNACKYSLKGTRVYLDVEENGGKAIITFRNISAFELNISSGELIERFVRGDKSRGTEGSGLGLSIAKSLTELQNGEFNITVDGDLFKVTIIFPTI